MSLPPGRYRFNGQVLEVSDSTGAVPLLVADSWFTQDGETIALDKHFSRFSRSADQQGLVNAPDAFLEAVRESLHTPGTWFPRIELTVRGELMYWLRDAPERTSAISLLTAVGDPRLTASIKGPDIGALEELRQHARARGADDAVILNNGNIADGTTTCLLWWRDGIPYTPPVEYERVSSVTMDVLSELFTAQGITVQTEAASPSHLAGLEVWAVNSLHGVRSVSSWIDGPKLSDAAPHALHWRAVYESARQA